MDQKPAIPQPQLYDHEGNPASLPADQIPEAIASGKYGYLKNEVIPVVGPDGKIASVAGSDLPLAFSRGFQLEPLESQNDRAMQEEYGDSPLEQGKAALEGAARGATLGLSDVAETRLGISTPEAIKAREKYNPVTSTVSNIAGAVAPVMLTGGAAAPEEAASLGASRLIPSVAVSDLGGAVTKGVAAGLDTSETAGIATRILHSAVSHGAGSAVEGAIYGAGNVVSEAALGDPDLSAEKVAANVGLGALLGAGLGGVLGAASEYLKKPATIDVPNLSGEPPVSSDPPGPAAPASPMAEAPLSEADQAARYGEPPGSLNRVLSEMDLSDEKVRGVIEGLAKRKDNADEIIEAARTLDAPVIESQVSASKHVQDIDSMLMQSPTPVGVARQQLVQHGLDKVEGAVSQSLGEGSDLSAAEVGAHLQDQFTEAFEKKAGPVKELYDHIEQYAPAIPVTGRSTGAISRNIMKVIEEEGLIKGTPEYQFVENMAQGLDQVDNLQKLKQFRTAMARSSGPETRYVAGVVKEKLDNLEQNAIRRYAETMRTPAAKQKILGLLDKIDEAKAGYKALREDMGQLGKNVLGRRKIYGPQDFLNAIEEQTPEKFAKKLFAKDNSRFLHWMNENFPEQTKLLMTFQRSALRDAATVDGRIVTSKVFRELDKLSPEVKAMMFNSHERQLLEAARTYMEALPKNINPSGTSKAEAYRRFFSNPISASVETAKDFGAQQALKRIVNTSGGQDSAKIHALIQLERMAQGINQSVKSGIKGFVSSGAGLAGTGAASAASVNYLNRNKLDSSKADQTKKDRERQFQKRYEEVAQAAGNPALLSDRVANSVAPIAAHAPKVSQGLTQTAIRGVQFLYQKAPKNPNAQYTLSPLSKNWAPSDADMAKWERYVTAVDHPLSVLSDMKKGMLSTEGVEALKNVYPKLYSEIVSGLTDHLTELKNDLPYKKRLQLSTFFGMPVDAATEPSFIAQMQAIHSQASAAQPQGGQGISVTGASKMRVASGVMTDTEKTLTRT